MERNYKNIENNVINKLKKDISIFEFRNDILSKKCSLNNKFIAVIKKIIITILSLATVSGTAIFAYNYKFFKDIDNRDISYALIEDLEMDSIKNAVDTGYIENINMDYKYSNDIGCKLNSFIISDNDLSLVIDFDFSIKNISQNNLLAKIIIYDEYKNIYCNYSPLSLSSIDNRYQNNFYKVNDLTQSSEISCMKVYTNLYETQTQVISQLLLSEPNICFPRSNKLYINIHDIGYIENDKYVYIDKNINWNFQIDIPEKFYNRTNLQYELAENIDGFTLDSFYITDTHSTLTFTSEYWDTDIEIIDENGVIYNSYSGNVLSNGYYKKNFHLNKNMITDKLYIKIIRGSYEDVIELLKQ